MAELDPIIDQNLDKEKVTHKVTTDYAHSRTHKGLHFYAPHATTLGVAGEQEYLIIGQTAGEHVAHFEPIVSANQEVKLEVFRGPDVLSGGTAIGIVNRNDRFTSNSTTTTAFHTPVVSGAGTLLKTEIIGSGNKSGGGTRGERERMLRDGTTYLVRLTAVLANTNIGVELDWYDSRDGY